MTLELTVRKLFLVKQLIFFAESDQKHIKNSKQKMLQTIKWLFRNMNI